MGYETDAYYCYDYADHQFREHFQCKAFSVFCHITSTQCAKGLYLMMRVVLSSIVSVIFQIILFSVPQEYDSFSMSSQLFGRITHCSELKVAVTVLSSMGSVTFFA